MGLVNNYTASFTAGTDSSEVDLKAESVMALVTPANLGVTSLTFKASLTKGGTFYPVYNEFGNLITITVSSTTAGWYDLTSIFPAGIRNLKLVAGSSITKDVKIITKGV